ncbi:tRNA (adenosine(37)-N6)-threonylcarbamoyltransferase complex dimerization subunit type 1 TsaB [Selenomonas sp.]|uniref:tRNA (adenosine(37)-N6)-threonylcarbamoyltransferase complex dimerization subunit type 1 TsaB n=1 Tax=Selenomonas sp. TaxID=2053611 RepID=UPI003A0FF05D
MPILSMDTSTQVSSVAVLARGQLAAEITMQARLTHSETLMPHVAQALAMAGVKKEALTGIAVSVGPGSFTGLRIGLAAAKAMSYALAVPLVGISSLEALALHYAVPGVSILALMDAQKKNAYVEELHWETTGAGLRLLVDVPVSVRPLAEAVARAEALASAGRTVVLLGDIVQKRVAGKVALPAGVLVPPPQLLLPRAAHVAWLGSQRLAAGEADNVMDLEPIYLRRSEAEVLFEQHHPERAALEVDEQAARALEARERHGTREVSR